MLYRWNTTRINFCMVNFCRYRQLAKLLGRVILHAVQYVSDHLENYLSCTETVYYRNSDLRKIYDRFLHHAVTTLVKGKHLGTLQFLVAMPWNLVSIEMLQEIYGVLTKWNIYAQRQPVERNNNENEFRDFEDELTSLNESDVFYLLTTLSNIVIKREGREPKFIETVAAHLFHVSVILQYLYQFIILNYWIMSYINFL